MGFRCGLVGLPGCGKTCIFNAITAAGASGYGAQEANRAVIEVPDARLARLAEITGAQKQVPTTVEVIDIPGLQAGSTAGEGRGSKLLGHVKDVDALFHVVRCFERPGTGEDRVGVDPVRDIETIDIELMVADAQTLANKIERLAKKAKAGEAEARRILADCEAVKAGLDEGAPARCQPLSDAQRASVADCHLASVKPVLYIANVGSPDQAETAPVRALADHARDEGAQWVLVCGRDEAEIAELSPDEQAEFLRELGLERSSMERLIRAGYETLGLVSFLTGGEKEANVWTCQRGTQAPQAAGKIHSDLEDGFIRMEVMRFEDLDALGSEAAVKKAGKLRVEGKDYVVQDGDVVHVRFSR